MCRLFAYVAPSSSAADAELGPAGIESFVSLAQVHGDGWGWSGIADPGTAPEVQKSVRSAAEDEAFGSAIAAQARAAMVHLRWATLGLGVQDDNTHPFLADGISFEHNGSLKPLDRVRSMLSPASVERLHGQTDSEMYFALIREKVADGLPLPAAALEAASRLRAAFPVSSLNAILLDAEQLIVVHASAGSSLDEEDIAEILAYDLPDEHAEDYFALRWRRKDDGTVLVGSTGVAGTDWEALPPESVTTIRLSDGHATTESLFAAEARVA
ncbi:class II glutamine amidotransferase [Microbacteriaceae bacterium 4G12]